MSHRCPATGCTRIVPDNVLGCYPHYQAVPAKLRDAYRWQTAKIKNLRGPRTPAEYRQALDHWRAARDAVIRAMRSRAAKRRKEVAR